MVEDDHATLTALSRGLEREGITVHGVRSAADALAWLEQEQPDLVVSDITMPNLDGLSAATTLLAEMQVPFGETRAYSDIARMIGNFLGSIGEIAAGNADLSQRTERQAASLDRKSVV